MALLRIEVTDTLASVDVCIVGAGVIGLALAKTLASAYQGWDILLLEKNDQIGAETSSRNSEVIHAGIYYPVNSLKARLCIRGRELLYAYCEQRGIAHKRIGKLIVADRHESPALETIHQRARAAGVDSLQFLDRGALSQLEPQVKADIALWSPDTGIVDGHGLMQQLLLEAQDAGVTLALRSQFQAAEPMSQGGFCLKILSGHDTLNLNTRLLINCAGLHAAHIAHRIEGLSPQYIPTVDFVKGNYFSLAGRSPFSHLIYPVPDPLHRGLGVHATLDLGGQCRFGPDIEPLPDSRADEINFTVDPARLNEFEQAIRRYFPAINPDRLQPAYSGVRPRLRSTDGLAADFMIQDCTEHGMAGLWQLFGIESPGLTASLAIAEYITDRIGETGCV